MASSCSLTLSHYSGLTVTILLHLSEDLGIREDFLVGQSSGLQREVSLWAVPGRKRNKEGCRATKFLDISEKAWIPDFLCESSQFLNIGSKPKNVTLLEPDKLHVTNVVQALQL